ncbi:hypothetical protein FDUTEX481_08080 [Tolypothrix sp. PCC 7601]|nr:hypothetical protein FDUTEX481_08080 [Tolypothrix sp. PCC 7601]
MFWLLIVQMSKSKAEIYGWYQNRFNKISPIFINSPLFTPIY